MRRRRGRRASAARRSATALAVSVAMLLLAACGSTVAQNNVAAPGGSTGLGQAQGDVAAELGVGGSEVAEDAGVGGAMGETGSPGGGALPPGRSGTAGVRGGAAGAATAPDGTSAAGGTGGGNGLGAGAGTGLKPGTPVEIGIDYKEGMEEAGEASGFKVVGADGKAVYDAIIDEINRTGGLKGHPLKPVYVELPAQTSETRDSLDQRMCSAWTEDHRVTAVASPGGLTEVLPACLQKKGIPMLFVNPAVSEAAAYTRYPLMHTLYPGQYRAFGTWIDSLAAQRWFGATPKIGLLRYDLPDQRRIAEQIVKPALARHGLRVAAEAAVDPNAGDGGIAAGKSALLNFQSKGVTHLLPQDTNGNMTLFGMKLAESNSYRPKWALTTYVLPYIQQTNNQSQLSGAGGLGWAPAVDVDDARDPGATPARKRCLDVMRRHGVRMADRSSAFQASYSCDLLFLLQAVANKAESLTASGLQAAFARVQAFDSAAFAGVGFRGGRRDAATSARYFAYDNGCLCFRYTTKPFGL